MSPSLVISQLLNGSVDSTLLLAFLITLCVFLSEDLTIVVVGVLTADGLLPIPLALVSLYVGMVIGDTFFYALGSFSRTHPRLAHYIEHDVTAPFRSWLERGYSFKVFAGHFVPGLRFISFVASGFFRFPFRTYFPMAIGGGLTVLIALFSVSYWFGSVTSGWVSHLRWGIALVFLITIFIVGRHNLLVYRKIREVQPRSDMPDV